MTHYKTLSTAAAIARRGFGPIVRETTMNLHRELDARIRAPRDPDAIQRHKAALEHEQRFGNRDHFGGRLAKMTFEMPPALSVSVHQLASHSRAGNSRAVSSSSRTTGSNAKKAASGSGADPDPERPHASNPASILSFATFRHGGAA